MKKIKNKNNYDIWLKLQRKIKSVNMQLIELQPIGKDAIYGVSINRLQRKLKILIKRLFTLNRKWRVGIATAALLIWLGNNNINAQTVFDHTSLDGSNGFKIVNSNLDGQFGYDISGAGDFNGDGIDDMIITSLKFDGGGTTPDAYIIFGANTPFSSLIDVATLDGTTGFSISETDGIGNTGRSVSSAGDFNKDGFDDLLIGQYQDFPTNDKSMFIIFGNDIGNSNINLSSLDGTNGVKFTAHSSLQQFARTVRGVGDINNDGFDDIAATFRTISSSNGEICIIYGTDTPFAALTDVDPQNVDFASVLYSHIPTDDATWLGGHDRTDAISNGDINGDGISDIVIGNFNADQNGQKNAGAVYVVFGMDQKLPEIQIDTLDGQAGFILSGDEYYGNLGHKVAVGDINGDGFDDIIASNYGWYYNNYDAKITVMFGKQIGFDPITLTSDLNGTDGFEITGFNMAQNAYGYLAIDIIDDVNGDGFDDVVIGANAKDVDAVQHSGKTYVMFGNNASWPQTYNINSLNDISGFVINGTAVDEEIGKSVAGIGDINGDGAGDFAFAGYDRDEAFVVFGEPNSSVYFNDLDSIHGFTAHTELGILFPISEAIGDFNGDGKDDFVFSRNKNTQVLFGTDIPDSSYINLNELDGTNGFLITSNNDTYDVAMVDINKDGFDDIAFGQPYAYQGGGSDGGENYVLFGKDGVQDASVDLDNPANNEMMMMYSDVPNDKIGYSMFNGGDINGDGFDDLYTINEYGYTGSVIFANENLSDTIDINNDITPSIGFKVINADEKFQTGDINGDGKNDIILEDPVYISTIFGQNTGIINNINPDTLSGTSGFRIELGSNVFNSKALDDVFDFNNDGYDDLLIRNISANPAIGNDTLFLIFGHDAPFTAFDFHRNPESLDGTNGMYITGLPVGEKINSVTTLDFNNDKSDDVILSLSPSNEVYLIYGNNTGIRTTNISNLQVSQVIKIQGFGSNELSVQKGGDLNGDGFSDLIIMDKKVIAFSEKIVAHILYGQNTYNTLYDIGDLQNYGSYDLVFSSRVSDIDFFDLLDYNGDGYNDVVFSIHESGWSEFKFLLSNEVPCITLETAEEIELCSGEQYTYPDGAIATNITANTSHISNLTSQVTGCDSTITTNISVTTVNTIVTINGNEITADNTTADAYQWFDCDLELPIDGETNYTFTATETGNYAVSIEESNCVDTSSCNSILISGIEDAESIVQSIWPNPTSGQINIRLTDNNAPVEISIFDVTGKLILQKEVAIKETDFTTELPGESGVYFVQLKSNLNIATFKIIKK